MSGHADVILAGGSVYTAGPDGARLGPAAGPGGRPATAVAIAGGRIAAVGDAGDAQFRDLTGPRTEVISLAGRAVLPGFQDAHVHPAFAGVTMAGCNLIGAATLDEALARISAYARAHPEKEWIAGGGWRMEWFENGTPGRQALDAVTGGRPAYLLNRDAHGAWVSTRALELAGLDARTPDPRDGRIEREAGGGPQGTLHEGAANLVGALVPDPSLAEQVAGLLLAQQHLHARGITGWQDAIVGSYLGSLDPLDAYLAAAESGQLTARVRGALWWDRSRGAEQLPGILARRERGQAGRFRAGTVKIMQDGVAENHTAAMIDPYLDPAGCHRDHGSGLSYVDPEALREYVTALDAEQFQVHLHAIGDRAVRESLDAIAAARAANGPAGATALRHHIAHLQVVHPDDVPRFAQLGVTANMQALWAAHEPQMDELTIPFLGPERAARQYVFGDLAAAGARLACGSDWSVTSASPLRAIHVAVNRALHGASGAEAEPFLPGQALDLAQALAAYTAGSAYVNHLDDETGTITPGKLADLIVLDRDPFAVPEHEIASITVQQTLVNGETVFRA
ncbi:MAG TPA: amidohydrolase [Streptosporangiaceae bacterium]|nr:amidohydrolase [Streptosporangiaceae bacterium]